MSNGLSQSLVSSICQDNAKQLWLTTLGGINSFDGKQFKEFTVADGLVSNSNESLITDNNGTVWCSSYKGVTAFTSSGVRNYYFKDNGLTNVVKIVCDKNNTIWALNNAGKLFKLAGEKFLAEKITDFESVITSIATDRKGNMYAAIYKTGIFKQTDTSGWRLHLHVIAQFVRMFLFDADDSQKIFFIDYNELFEGRNNQLHKLNYQLTNSSVFEFTDLIQDKQNGLWIGTNNGAIYIKNNTCIFFNSSNGFTNSRVLKIFNDADNRIWFGTADDGIYYFVNNSFLIYDRSEGLGNDVIMALAKTPAGDIFMGTNGGGLISYSKSKITQVQLPIARSNKLNISSVFCDSLGNLWFSTADMGLWTRKMINGKYRYFQVWKMYDHFFGTIAEGSDHAIWVAGSPGCFYIEKGKPQFISQFDVAVFSFLSVGADSMLAGTSAGLRLIKNKRPDKDFRLPQVEGSLIQCLNKYKSFVLIGTNDRGLIVWNKKENTVQEFRTEAGLYSNIIYSLDVVGDQLWVGTGRGVNKFLLKEQVGRLTLQKQHLPIYIVETNQNAILHTDTSIWVGTVRGVNVYQNNATGNFSTAPATIIQSVNLFADPEYKINYQYHNGYRIPVNLSLPSDQGHIAIKYGAVQFEGDENSSYQYMLVGFDKKFSKPMNSDFVDYPNLPPGEYTFKVRALNSLGVYNKEAEFSFVITPTITQTLFFKLSIIVMLVVVLYCIYDYKKIKDQQRARYILILKQQEQERVRRQTAEDFHDDIGNKLTRINLLSELLDKRIPAELPEQKKLVSQIRSSAIEMFNGTKDILWALNPNNDRISEVLENIDEFAHQLFENLTTTFTLKKYDPEIGDLRLPLGYSRHVTLIFKELLNNILKHAFADEVTLTVNTTFSNQIQFVLQDNGSGFDKYAAFEGNGLKNIKNRAIKMNGNVSISCENGTCVILSISIPTISQI